MRRNNVFINSICLMLLIVALPALIIFDLLLDLICYFKQTKNTLLHIISIYADNLRNEGPVFIKKLLQECWCCCGTGLVKTSTCKTCKGTGVYQDKHHYFIYTDKK